MITCQLCFTIAFNEQPQRKYETLPFTSGSIQGANPVSNITKMPITVGTQFKNDMVEMVEVLTRQEPHYVRCIMPNSNKAPDEYDEELVTQQVSLLEYIETYNLHSDSLYRMACMSCAVFLLLLHQWICSTQHL